jgi:hypothetical protein
MPALLFWLYMEDNLQEEAGAATGTSHAPCDTQQWAFGAGHAGFIRSASTMVSCAGYSTSAGVHLPTGYSISSGAHLPSTSATILPQSVKVELTSIYVQIKLLSCSQNMY